MELSRNDNWMYDLQKKENGDIIFSVVCGGIGMYEASIVFNDDEIGGYLREGDDYLVWLAKDISQNTLKYSNRFVKSK